MSTPFQIVNGWRMVDFGKNLAQLRKARGLTQAELSDLLDIQQRLIGRWEQGQGKPQFDYILKLADVLEVSLDCLLRGSDAVPLPAFAIRNKKLQELCRQVDQMKPQEQEVICHFLGLAVRQEQLKKIVAQPLGPLHS